MVLLLVWLLVGILALYCVRLMLPMTGLPANAQTVIIIILAIILLLWLVAGYAPQSWVSRPR